MFDFLFFFNSILIGIGLAMDAFSVSLANGLNEPSMKKPKITLVSGTFAVFQALMPLTGWFFVTKLIEIFDVLIPFIPYISLALLCYIGGKMLYDGLKPEDDGCDCEKQAPGTAVLTFGALVLQGIATSIDALSVGFTIADLSFPMALLEASIIAVVTFGICYGGIVIGKTFGTKLSNRASILGGVILIAIGFEIFISSFFS